MKNRPLKCDFVRFAWGKQQQNFRQLVFLPMN